MGVLQVLIPLADWTIHFPRTDVNIHFITFVRHYIERQHESDIFRAIISG